MKLYISISELFPSLVLHPKPVTLLITVQTQFLISCQSDPVCAGAFAAAVTVVTVEYTGILR